MTSSIRRVYNKNSLIYNINIRQSSLINYPTNKQKRKTMTPKKYPETPEYFIEFNYESVNDALYAEHPNLSGYWTDLGWDSEFAYATYYLELFDGKKATVLVDHWGNVTMSDEVKQEMDDIG